MKIAFLAGLFLLIGTLYSCATATTSPGGSLPKLALEAKLLDMLVQTGQPQEVVISADLNEEEINLVIAAIDQYNLLRNKWKVASSDATTAATSILTLELDYDTLSAYYSQVQSIVNKHWDEYTAQQQVQLSGYHRQAVSIDATVRQLLAAKDQAAYLDMILQYGLLIAQIAL